MKLALELISVNRASAFQLDPSLTGAEAIALRALVAGQTRQTRVQRAPYELGDICAHDETERDATRSFKPHVFSAHPRKK